MITFVAFSLRRAWQGFWRNGVMSIAASATMAFMLTLLAGFWVVQTGLSAGLDFVESTFRLEFSDGERIAGRLAEDFTSEKTLQLHGAYRAILTRTARISYSVSEERLDWLLRAISTRP